MFLRFGLMTGDHRKIIIFSIDVDNDKSGLNLINMSVLQLDSGPKIAVIFSSCTQIKYILIAQRLYLIR